MENYTACCVHNTRSAFRRIVTIPKMCSRITAVSTAGKNFLGEKILPSLVCLTITLFASLFFPLLSSFFSFFLFSFVLYTFFFFFCCVLLFFPFFFFEVIHAHYLCGVFPFFLGRCLVSRAWAHTFQLFAF